MVGRPGQPDQPKTETEAADEAMTRLREQQEAQIIITTTDAAKPASADPYAEMDPLQKSNLIVFLQDMLREKDSQVHELLDKLQDINDKLTESLRTQKESTEIQKRLEKVIADLQMQLAQERAKNTTLKYDNETLKARLDTKQKQQFDTKSHDRRKSKKKKQEDEGDDFDCILPVSR